jgi:hypothetical protein
MNIYLNLNDKFFLLKYFFRNFLFIIIFEEIFCLNSKFIKKINYLKTLYFVLYFYFKIIRIINKKI